MVDQAFESLAVYDLPADLRHPFFADVLLPTLPACYDRLLDFFHSPALDLNKLTRVWRTLVFRAHPGILRINGKPVLVGDGIKVAKSGRKMPAVKKVHQQSESNTKPEYIFGHSCQAVAVLAYHHKTDAYRDPVRRKIAAYHRHIQLGLIAQGLLQILSARNPQCVWLSFGSWIRTIRPGLAPSEQVVAIALRNTLPEFLATAVKTSILVKFIRDWFDLSRSEGTSLAA